MLPNVIGWVFLQVYPSSSGMEDGMAAVGEGACSSFSQALLLDLDLLGIARDDDVAVESLLALVHPRPIHLLELRYEQE